MAFIQSWQGLYLSAQPGEPNGPAVLEWRQMETPGLYETWTVSGLPAPTPSDDFAARYPNIAKYAAEDHAAVEAWLAEHGQT